METGKSGKLLLAVLQGDDYERVVTELNRGGFYATLLNSVGGFLKKRSVTIMVGLESEKLDAAIAIIKKCAGERIDTVYQKPMIIREPNMNISPVIPVNMPCGGAAVFVLDMDRMERF
ncbi:MAG: cyclic-di-AMP receptor [Oscillospiraceae bacterium]|nr:cyclic-di-AMP receptor [Oscillospiraceae bacterium]